MDHSGDEDSPKMALMYEIGAKKLKVLIKGEYIPTLTFSVAYWELSITGTKGPTYVEGL